MILSKKKYIITMTYSMVLLVSYNVKIHFVKWHVIWTHCPLNLLTLNC